VPKRTFRSTALKSFVSVSFDAVQAGDPTGRPNKTFMLGASKEPPRRRRRRPLDVFFFLFSSSFICLGVPDSPQPVIMIKTTRTYEKKQRTAFLRALARDDADVLSLLWRHGPCRLQTVLQEAVRCRAKACIDAMLAAGTCSINAVTGWKNALTEALLKGDVEMARWLYTRHKARWYYPADNPTWDGSKMVLRMAIHMKRFAPLQFVLQRKVDPNFAMTKNVSPLQLAISDLGGASAVCLLLKAKADPNRDPHNTLCRALYSLETVDMLVRAKIDVGAASNQSGDTALHTLVLPAYFPKHIDAPEVLKLLLEAKADPCARNHAGLLPVELLRYKDVFGVHRMLRRLLDQYS
jgi:hypothetical protein